MKFFASALLFLILTLPVFAQVEEKGVFQLNQNPLEPGQAPVGDPRFAPNNEADGIILPQENSDLPLEVAVVFDEKKKRLPASKDFIFGFIAGGAFIAFVSFFMLKYARN